MENCEQFKKLLFQHSKQLNTMDGNQYWYFFCGGGCWKGADDSDNSQPSECPGFYL
jgi:hypothetical protein